MGGARARSGGAGRRGPRLLVQLVQRSPPAGRILRPRALAVGRPRCPRRRRARGHGHPMGCGTHRHAGAAPDRGRVGRDAERRDDARRRSHDVPRRCRHCPRGA
ncbi:hypothetical protein FA951_12940 [Dermacoccus nishinomiyaensis]|nr:hypothetical protein FA951_12940 [Dermacoccus nishinomiyaensis]